MCVIEGLSNIPEDIGPTCVGVGVFDGVHWGHRAIFEKVTNTASSRALLSVALTFDKHPSEILAPDRVPAYICSLDQRIEMIRSTGIDIVVVARFDKELAEIPRDRFFREILRYGLNAKAVVVGANFRFGRAREGDIRYLRSEGAVFGVETVVVSSVIIGGAPVSSTRIRGLLAEGEVKSAADLLGHPFMLRGTVVEGRKVGRTLGFPTANLQISANQALPSNGVYAVEVNIGDGIYTGLCNIGNNPTFNCSEISVEVYLKNFDGDLYGKNIDVLFIDRIRGEVKFSGPEELVNQIQKDLSYLEDPNGLRDL